VRNAEVGGIERVWGAGHEPAVVAAMAVGATVLCGRLPGGHDGDGGCGGDPAHWAAVAVAVQRRYFGALVNPVRTDPSSTPAEVSALENEVDRRLDIVNHFYTYGQAVGTQGEVQHIAGGRIPMVTWGATSTTNINNGSQDAYITAQATRLKNLGAPVILRYFHEPEGAYRSTIIGSPAAYIAAWKHARSLFTAAVATNVVWMFTTTAYSFRVVSTPSPQAFYPGHDQVDWIAADGYNFAPGKPGAKLNSFQTIFAKWYAWAATCPSR